jgi:hypothetical protein
MKLAEQLKEVATLEQIKQMAEKLAKTRDSDEYREIIKKMKELAEEGIVMHRLNGLLSPGIVQALKEDGFLVEAFIIKSPDKDDHYYTISIP